MRECYDKNLLGALAEQPMEAAPLTQEELERVLALAQQSAQEAAAKTAAPIKKGWLPMKKQRLISLAAAACVVLLGGVNVASPALAESLPVVGGLFAWINRDEDAQLHSDRLDDYAADVGAVAGPAGSAANTAAVSAYPLTVQQVYLDEMYLRLTVTVTAQDDSLAGYRWLGTGDVLLQSPEDLLPGTVTVGEQRLAPVVLPRFERKDAQTFVGSLEYRLESPLGTGTATLYCAALSGYDGSLGEDGEYTAVPLGGEACTVAFPLSEGAVPTRSAAAVDPAPNGITVLGLTAAPGESRLELFVPAQLAHGLEWDLRTAGGTELQPANSSIAQTEGGTLFRQDFDAVPEDADTLVLTVLDDTGAELAVFTLTLS